MPQPISFSTWRAGGYANSAAPRRADSASLQQLSGQTMGTYWSLKFDNPAMLPLAAVQDALSASFALVIRQMSTWDPASDISRFAAAPAGTRIVMPREFASVLECALHWFDQSGGALDPTVGPLVSAWGFGAHANHSESEPFLRPSAQAIAAARARVGCQQLAYDAAARSILQVGTVQLDFSGIAKGFAVDHAAQALAALGVENMLMEIGGELVARGHRQRGMPWRVKIDPGVQAELAPLELSDTAMATSGDRWHNRSSQGARWSHAIDPRTGMPTDQAIASVTVLHAECMHADALATVLTVLGPELGPVFAEREGIAALFAMRENGGHIRLHRTSAFQRFEQ